MDKDRFNTGTLNNNQVIQQEQVPSAFEIVHHQLCKIPANANGHVQHETKHTINAMLMADKLQRKLGHERT